MSKIHWPSHIYFVFFLFSWNVDVFYYRGRGNYYNNQTSGQYNPSGYPYSQAPGYYPNVTASPGGSMPMGSPQNAVPVQPMNLGPAHGQQNPYMMPQQVGFNMYQNQQRGAYMSPSVPGYPPRMANGSQNGNMATYSIGSSATTPAASGSSLQKAVREKRVLTITDKNGNPIEIGGSKPASSLNAAASTAAPAPEQEKSEAKTPKTSLLEAAKKAIEEKEAAQKEKIAKEEAEKAAAEEVAKIAAAKALEEEEAARKQKEEEELAKAKKEEEERQKAEAAKKAEAEKKQRHKRRKIVCVDQKFLEVAEVDHFLHLLLDSMLRLNKKNKQQRNLHLMTRNPKLKRRKKSRR